MSRPVKSIVPQFGTAKPPGKLFIVGTPIGNLEDITFRALRILKEVDLIACEDTRHTQKLLNHYSISTHTISYHQHNEMARAPELIAKMEEGSHLALVSDAGMPGISDPGFRLVQLALQHDIPVVPVPGPSAFLAALAAAGLAAADFRFVGFLPSRRAERQKHLQALAGAEMLVLYESPYRLLDMLEDVQNILGNRAIVVAREVTKLHEEFVRGSVSEVLGRLKMKPVKGEITLIVGPPVNGEVKPAPGLSISEEIERVMAHKGVDERDALKMVARQRGISKSDVYRDWQMEKSKASTCS